MCEPQDGSPHRVSHLINMMTSLGGAQERYVSCEMDHLIVSHTPSTWQPREVESKEHASTACSL